MVVTSSSNSIVPTPLANVCDLIVVLKPFVFKPPYPVVSASFADAVYVIICVGRGGV